MFNFIIKRNRLLNDAEIAKSKRDFELKKAAYDVEVQTKVNKENLGSILYSFALYKENSSGLDSQTIFMTNMPQCLSRFLTLKYYCRKCKTNLKRLKLWSKNLCYKKAPKG